MKKEVDELNVRQISSDVFEIESQTNEGEFHKVENVNGEWVCDCRGYKFRGKCAHIERLGRWLKMNDGVVGKEKTAVNKFQEMAKAHEIEIKSAFHKSIRAGDVSGATYWGAWFAVLESPDKVIEYVKSIVFQETCNWKIFYRLTDDWLVCTQILAASRKTWECRCCNGFFVRQMEARERAIAKPIEKGELNISSIDDGYELLYNAIRMQREGNPKLMTSYLELLKKHAEGKIPFFILRQMKSRFDAIFLINLLFGKMDEAEICYIDEERLKTAEKSIELAMEMKPFPEYVYDVNTERGSKIIIENWREISNFEDVPGIDLRWSGLAISRLWRELAFIKFGDDYKNVAWSAVQIPPELWQLAVKEDAENRVFKEIEKKYGSLVFERRIKGEYVDVGEEEILTPRKTAELLETFFERIISFGDSVGAKKMLNGLKKGNTVATKRTLFDMIKNMERTKAASFLAVLKEMENQIFGDENS